MPVARERLRGTTTFFGGCTAIMVLGLDDNLITHHPGHEMHIKYRCVVSVARDQQEGYYRDQQHGSAAAFLGNIIS